MNEKPKKQRKDGGTRCAAWGCDKSKFKDGVGVFEFPDREKSPERFRFWCKTVARTRLDFKFVKGTSRLCADHFDRDQIDNWMQIKIAKENDPVAAAKMKWRLVPKAKPNPDLFPKRPHHGTPVSSGGGDDIDTRSGCLTPRRPPDSRGKAPVSTQRPWVAKKDRKKAVADAMEASCSQTPEEPAEIPPPSPTPGTPVCEAENMDYECNIKKPKLVDEYVQTEHRKRPPHRSIRVQSISNTISQGTQTEFQDVYPCNCALGRDALPDPPKSATQKEDCSGGPVLSGENDNDSALDTEDELIPSQPHDSDPDYEPDSEEDSEDCDEKDFTHSQNKIEQDPVSDDKYLIFHSCLMKLFASCPVCSSESSGDIKRIGTFISIEQHCSNKECRFSRIWDSQPMCGKVPAGNILLSSAILFSGAIPAKVLQVFKLLRCQAICKSTYFSHQHQYLSPAVKSVWSREQQDLVNGIKKSDAPLVVGGDGRSDTPGHSAKYGSYSLMDLVNKKIIAMELVQSTEVKSSVHMEKEGLIRCVRFLENFDVAIHKIITDRHSQITKWLRENLGGTLHLFDAWHIAKNLKMKILKLGKEKGCELAGEWCKAITNHLYYIATNTTEGNSELIMAKWLSLDNHLHNIHKGHGKLFPKCGHGRLGKRRIKSKKWLNAGTKVSTQLTKIITATRLVKDIGKISCGQQTSGLEAFHSVVNHFAPKQIHFFPEGMKIRLCIAALHYNENGNKEQAVTKDGKERWDIFFPKVKKGGHSVRPVRQNSTYGYAQRLLLEVQYRCKNNIKDSSRVKCDFLSGRYEHPEKSVAVENYKSKFKRFKKP